MFRSKKREKLYVYSDTFCYFYMFASKKASSRRFQHILQVAQTKLAEFKNFNAINILTKLRIYCKIKLQSKQRRFERLNCRTKRLLFFIGKEKGYERKH